MDEKVAYLQGFPRFHTGFHTCGRTDSRSQYGRQVASGSSGFPACSVAGRLWKTAGRRRSSILRRRSPGLPLDRDFRRETHLPAERTPPEAAARVPGPDVHPRRAGDSEAPPRAWPQAALGLRPPTVHRRHRLSRSRDFETVYRRGSSASTRQLVLHWFPREEDADGPARLGLAVPRSVGSAVVRNRLKRMLREAWRGLLDDVPPGHDYVLVARAGVAEPAQVRGLEWLSAEIAELLGRVPR